jgi:hypothetical protein
MATTKPKFNTIKQVRDYNRGGKLWEWLLLEPGQEANQNLLREGITMFNDARLTRGYVMTKNKDAVEEGMEIYEECDFRMPIIEENEHHFKVKIVCRRTNKMQRVVWVSRKPKNPLVWIIGNGKSANHMILLAGYPIDLERSDASDGQWLHPSEYYDDSVEEKLADTQAECILPIQAWKDSEGNVHETHDDAMEAQRVINLRKALTIIVDDLYCHGVTVEEVVDGLMEERDALYTALRSFKWAK